MVKNVNFELDENIILQLRKIAKDNERSLSAQIRTILLAWLRENSSDMPGTQN